jgi:hypothetical protein
MTCGMAVPPVTGATWATAVPAAPHAIPVQSTAASVARSRRNLVMFVAAYEVS